MRQYPLPYIRGNGTFRLPKNDQSADGIIPRRPSGGRIPLSPVSLITGLDVGEMSGLPVVPGDQVFVDKKTIILFSKSSRIIFRFDEAAIYDSLLRDYAVPLPLPAIKESSLQSRHPRAYRAFLQSPAEKPFRFRKRGISGSRTKRMEDARKEVLDICYDKAAVTLAGMTGRYGLTPSGDGFPSGGVLADSCFPGQWDHPFAQALRQTIHAALEIPTTSAGPFFPVRFPAISAAR